MSMSSEKQIIEQWHGISPSILNLYAHRMYVYTYIEWLLVIISGSGIFEKQEIFTIFRMFFFF